MKTYKNNFGACGRQTESWKHVSLVSFSQGLHRISHLLHALNHPFYQFVMLVAKPKTCTMSPLG